MRLAFVVQRYGEDIGGGAELHCRRIAERMARRHHVEVLTTTALDYMSWKHHYPVGRTELNGVTVNRFRVDYTRDKRRFDRHSIRIYGRPHSILDELEWIRLAGPVASGLLRALSERRVEFDVIFFFTYEYATTYFGIQIAPERAVLIPTAHDAPPIYLDLFRPIFRLPRYLIYNTPAEKTFIERCFANADMPNVVVGVGVEPPPAEASADRFRDRWDIQGDLLLYVGRVDESKGCGELFDFFTRYTAMHGGDLKLVLIGQPVMRIPSHPHILSLGYVDEQVKYDGIAASLACVAPSPYESLSMTCQEAWQMERAVLANGRSEVLADQVRRSGGGWMYHDFASFADALDAARTHPALRASYGSSGRQFVESTYGWDVIEAQYEDVIRIVASKVSAPEVNT